MNIMSTFLLLKCTDRGQGFYFFPSLICYWHLKLPLTQEIPTVQVVNFKTSNK